MFRRLLPSMIACGVLALALSARTAEAAFVSADFGAGQSRLDDRSTGEATGTSTPGTPDQAPSPAERDGDRLTDDASAGMNSVSPNVSGTGAPPLAATTAVEVVPQQIVLYLLRESDLLLPVPFLDGIFRPPRS